MIKERIFGTAPDGSEITIYTLENKDGITAEVMNYGAILVNLYVPNNKGEVVDVNLGYDTLEKYFTNGNCFGGSVGPIANRTAGASFMLDGKKVQLVANDGENNLHTDPVAGFPHRVFSAKKDEKKNAVTFTTTLTDGELGLPGNREFTITYTVTKDNGLQIDYTGKTDKNTMYNPTNHSYFNLKGHDNGSILDEELWLGCHQFTEIVKGAIPTGKLIDVAGTPMDFTTSQPIGSRIRAHYEQRMLVKGYDHNFVIDGDFGTLRKAAILKDEAAGRCMEVYTDMPGIQVYTGNWIGPHLGKGGALYKRRGGIALETQFFPNSINEESFITPLLTPEKPVKYTTIYKFV